MPTYEPALSSAAPRLRLVDRSTAVARAFGANPSPATSVAVCIPACNARDVLAAVLARTGTAVPELAGLNAAP